MTAESVYDQIRKYIEEHKGHLPPNWANPSDAQLEALKEGGGSIPAEVRTSMEGGRPANGV